MGLGRILKKITKGLRKAVKSKFGKLLLVGAAMYMAGGMSKAVAPAATGGAPGSAPAPTPDVAAAGGVAPVESIATPPATSAPPPLKAGGFLNRAVTGVGNFIEKNPMASSMAFNAIASGLGPDETELMEKQEEIRQRRWQNMQVPSGVGFSVNPRGILNQGVK
jgi:hypothetical protein